MNVFLLLFADDAVLFSASQYGLQMMPDLQEYSNIEISVSARKSQNNDF